jgi:hypothetical protein
MGQSSKRTVIVAGNCQASFLHRALTESPELNDEYRLVYFRNFRKGDQDILAIEDLEACALLIEQIAHKQPELPNKDRLPADCRVVKFPILWMNSLWPTRMKDPRNVPTEQHPAGPYPYGDKLVLQLLDKGLTPEQVAERYLETDINEVVDIGRFHEINVLKAQSLDERADVRLGGFVYDNHAATRLFVTHNHPTMPMLRHIADSIFEAIGIRAPESDLVAASGGMQHIHMPVHPQVAEALGLEWYDPELEYRYHDQKYRIAEFMRRYAAFE